MREEDTMDAVPEESDTALVASARDGDEEAFAELWRRHAAAGRTVARSFSTEDPDDVVAEAYLRILAAVRNGKGPTTGFRPYLFTTIRSVAAGWGQRRREHPLEDAEAIPDPSSTEAASMEALDRSLTVTAFRSLPERWQEVLWYTEVEQMTAAAVAPLLGLTANGTAALAYRAREGLRQAWIQAHIAASPEGSEHRWTTERVGAYSRGGLGKRDTARIERHLAECAKCSIVAAEARNVGSRLTLVLLPLLLGVGGAAAYAATVREGAAATAAAATFAKVNAPAAPAAARGVRRLATRAGRAGTVTGTAVAGVAVAAGIVGAVVLGPQLFASSRPSGSDTTSAAAPAAEAPERPAATQPSAPAPTVVPAPVVPSVPSVPFVPEQPETAAPPASESPKASTAPVATTPASPPKTTPVPPAAPVVLSTFPVDWVTAAATVPLAGTGIPGATVSALAAGRSTPLATGTVAPDGSWSLTLDISGLADGSWTLDAVQTTADGTSTPAAFSIAIDRTALAPVILTVDTGSGAEANRLAPVITGTAEAGATVELADDGNVVATVTADDTGRWSSPELVSIPVDYAITARQTDRLGNVSPDSAPVTGSALVPQVTASGAPGTVSISVQGEPGTLVEVWADGTASRFTLTLDASGRADAIYGWTSGGHRIGVVAVYGDRHGVLSDVPVTLP
ncbi:sigma-70 family RNA polymerase sigma factor [Leifsonia virtsii]|uniref:Sigma-70 family RNA polymerase sigma factor n=1 Tax=Leifsonia virtsii TaxID=3035915 RepID=A0ABT8IVX4_9MICO|nr:sigma-70 family RNA polymerase sigma factor [Leifsonia virtsii]MDN4596857.1 sigma-70 family RNA polymerase sigma factor [Leifsonia virtsii]